MTLNLKHVEDLDRCRIAYVVSQRAKALEAAPLFLSLPHNETYAMNGVARFLRTNSKVKVFGNNRTSYKTVFTNLGRRDHVYMHSKYLGLRSGKFGAVDFTKRSKDHFHPLLGQSKIQEFMLYEDAEEAGQVGDCNIIIGNESRFATELVQNLHLTYAKLELVVINMGSFNHTNELHDVFKSGWRQLTCTVGAGEKKQHNFVAWTYDIPTATVTAIIEKIHPFYEG